MRGKSLFVSIFIIIILSNSNLFAQSDYFDKGSEGPLFGFNYVVSENYDGFWVTSGFTPDSRLNISCDLGRVKYSPILSKWLIKPEISYLFLKPFINFGGVGLKQSIASRLYMFESDLLVWRGRTATDRSYIFETSLFYNIRLSPKTMIQPILLGGISLDTYRIWDYDGNEFKTSEKNGIFGAGLTYFVNISDSKTFQFSTKYEKKKEINTYYLSISLLHDRSEK